METNLRNLLVEELVTLPMEVEIEEGRLTQTLPTIVYTTTPGQTVMAVTEDGEGIFQSQTARRFFPPLVKGLYDAAGINERVVALFEATAAVRQKQPVLQPSGLESFFREMLPLERGEGFHVLACLNDAELLGDLSWAAGAFSGATLGHVLGIKGKPGAIVETPVGTGMFVSDVQAVVGAWIYSP